MSVDPETDFATVAEAANLVGVSTVTVARWLKRGCLSGYRVGPRRIRIRRAELAKLFTLLSSEKLDDEIAQQPNPVGIVLRPLSPEEIEQRLEASRNAKALREAILNRRQGKPLPSSRDDYFFRYRLRQAGQDDQAPFYEDRLLEMVRQQLQNLLNLVVPVYRGKEVKIDGLKLLDDLETVYEIFPPVVEGDWKRER